MGKRSDYVRVERDFYPTPIAAVEPLIPHLPYAFDYVEPCAGDGRLIDHISELTEGHPFIEHWLHVCPTWVLFDADWMHTKQSAIMMTYCSKVVSIGRVKWIEGSKGVGKDNCCWYLFDITKEPNEPTEFYGRAV